mmetsp:Transcript_17095/g.50473  ORF Transcript_17095/g.50473 Transcript_17095/m.50473 type:complete len:176 (+) Transcript_17095:1-528(+)
MGGVFPSLPGRGTLHLLQPWPRSLSQGGQGGGQGGGQAWAVRKAARSRSGGGQAWGVPCVYSLEVAQRQPDAEGTLCDRFGTACFATGAFGFAAAAALTGVLARGEKLPRRARRGPAAAVAEAAHRGGGGELPSEEASGGDLPLYDSHCHAIADAGALLGEPEGGGLEEGVEASP